MAKTEGGEAFFAQCRHTGKIRHLQGPPPWYALWTHSHCEQLVHDQLAVRGFEVFLPKLEIWSRRAGVKHRILKPMFPGYLFVRDELSEARYAELLGARGLVCVLGNGAGRLTPVPNQEIDAIRAVVQSNLPALPHPYLAAGQRVRITRGPLADVEGILVGRNAGKGLLVLSVQLFQRSVAVEVDCSLATAA
ncbi:transcription termination/antitermination protein NusG [Nitrospira moscoviensis]|uniref:Putative Transcription antitermination protein nusG n=1 Tax=Nitrospira moscoviensis TaxID=42253 RepID=A0A0K2GDN4_NITMO|nr:transcription termination/antitermination NusG family protein [Nitrospira moscoviensis]ALA59066.1 putative Transcription antitermination protein nusG [Nitrospira moscoviensis]